MLPSQNIAPPYGYMYLGVHLPEVHTIPDLDLLPWNNWVLRTGNVPAITAHTTDFPGGFNYILNTLAEDREAIPLINWIPRYISPTPPYEIREIDLGEINSGGGLAGRSWDVIILEAAHFCAEYDKPVLLNIAPFSNEGDSPLEYANFFRRVVILFKGGTVTQIEDELKAHGLRPLQRDEDSPLLPPLHDGASVLTPALKTNFIFSLENPIFGGIFDRKFFYPGDEFVDWIGHPSIEGLPSLANMEHNYRNFSLRKNKPFIITDFYLDEDFEFELRTTMYWAKKLDYVKAMVVSEENTRLLERPRALSAFKKEAASDRFIPPYDGEYLSPWVYIARPAPGTLLSGGIGIQAIPHDDQYISNVEYYVNDVLRFKDITSPSIFWWDTTKEGNGTYRIGVKVRDTQGNESQLYNTYYRIFNE